MLCTGRTAHSVSRGIALLYHDHGTRKGLRGQRYAPAALYPGKESVSIVQEVGWALGPVWTFVENLAPTGIRTPDCPARSQLLYRLSYRAPRTHTHVILSYGNVCQVQKRALSFLYSCLWQAGKWILPWCLKGVSDIFILFPLMCAYCCVRIHWTQSPNDVNPVVLVSEIEGATNSEKSCNGAGTRASLATSDFLFVLSSRHIETSSHVLRGMKFMIIPWLQSALSVSLKTM